MTNLFKLKKKRLKKIIKKPIGDQVLDVLNIAFLIFFCLLIIIPLLNLIAFAFSTGTSNSKVTFLPVGFTFDMFNYVVHESSFWRSLLNSVIITLFVTVFSNLFMAMAAYPLSKQDFPFKNIILIFFVITMLFSAGIVPTVLLLRGLGLYGTIWAVIIISINNVFNLLLYKSFFEGLPKETIEAAEVDGVNNFQMFYKIVLPMSLPVFASCAFFSIVGTWNSYSGALMFIGTASDKEAFWPLSLYIYDLLQRDPSSDPSSFLSTNLVNVQSASIIISVIPILVIYPFVIRYIKSGITIGSVM